MLKGGRLIYILLLCLFILSIVLSDSQAGSTETYLEDLHSQGKERVIVIFKDEVNLTLIEKYQGKLIRIFTTIKALVCEIPQENIESLKQEGSVEDVVLDVLMESNSGDRQRDPEELAEELRLKEEYLQRIKDEYNAAIQKAYQEYLNFYQTVLIPKKKVLDYYSKLLQYLRDKGYANTWIYKYLLSRYYQLLREYYTAWMNAIKEYYAKITQAKDAYVQLAGEWREKVSEMMALAYDGTVTVRWNNLEAGLNSKAAWDNYNLDGAGIKIAIIDNGINYTLENLNDNYLGGYDFVYNDNDPMPNLDQTEDHGTFIASLAVGEGVNKVVGVAYNASYYSLRVGDSDTGHPLATDVMAAIEWATDPAHKADIISMSLGTYGLGSLQQPFETICNNAYNAGILLVAASGNDGFSYSSYPARFDNVISVGAHQEDQTIASFSNGGVDVIAPGRLVYAVGADNTAWLWGGTSFATPHAAALLALQLQYARERGIQVNNAYLWEVMKHGAKDMPLITDPVFKGSGKIWAAETNEPPPEPHLGSIDLMGTSIWPFDFTFTYYDYLYLLDGLYPAYFLGTTMSQDIIIDNISDAPDIPNTFIENLNVTTIQKYRQTANPLETGNPLPGDSTEDFEAYEPIALNPGDIARLPDDYYLPIYASPGLYNVVLDLEFNLVDNPRLLKITLNEASIWCPPGPPPQQTGYGFAR